jgi:diadenosine tetraphosphatase ApaH/serine/threonine PP2A family protein phosphatase
VESDRVEEVSSGERYFLGGDALHFVNPGSVDASRKGGEKHAQCALLDTQAWTLEFLSLQYDAAATEAKSAVFGYRLTPWRERMYTLARRLLTGWRRAAAR